MRPVRNKLVRTLSHYTARQLVWPWAERFAAGTLTLIDGDPDEGKSLITLDLAARLTSGRPLPEGGPALEPCSVVLVCAEDLMEETLLPRLEAAGADCSRVHLFSCKDDAEVEHL